MSPTATHGGKETLGMQHPRRRASSPENTPSRSLSLPESASDPAVVITPKISEPWTVDKVLETVHPEPPATGSSSPIPFFHILERLKTNKREGWRRFGINR